ncbi:MAG: inositol monophosphatase family protein [Acidobacteriota bacterium]
MARRGRDPHGRPGAGAPGGDLYLSSCVDCARVGGRVLTDSWGRGRIGPIREKGRRDYVTDVDRRAEEAILRIVRDRFPEHAILAEESPPSEGSVGYRWYVDPLDGTTNFIHGYPLFAVSVAVADPLGMRAAAVYDPLRDEMFTAARGAGARLNGAPIRASAVGDLPEGLLVTGFPFRSLARLDEYLASLRAFLASASGIRRDGSAALNLAYVACGRYDGFWEMSLAPWDVAAGSLIVREAGGTVTDFLALGGFLDSGDIIAANPQLHPAMLKIVQRAYRIGRVP